MSPDIGGEAAGGFRGFIGGTCGWRWTNRKQRAYARRTTTNKSLAHCPFACHFHLIVILKKGTS